MRLVRVPRKVRVRRGASTCAILVLCVAFTNGLTKGSARRVSRLILSRKIQKNQSRRGAHSQPSWSDWGEYLRTRTGHNAASSP